MYIFFFFLLFSKCAECLRVCALFCGVSGFVGFKIVVNVYMHLSVVKRQNSL